MKNLTATDSKRVTWNFTDMTSLQFYHIGVAIKVHDTFAFEVRMFPKKSSQVYIECYSDIVRATEADHDFPIWEKIVATGDTDTHRFIIFDRMTDHCLDKLQTPLTRGEVNYVAKRLFWVLSFCVDNSTLVPQFAPKNIAIREGRPYLTSLGEYSKESTNHVHDMFCPQQDCLTTKGSIKTIFNVLVYLSCLTLPWKKSSLSEEQPSERNVGTRNR